MSDYTDITLHIENAYEELKKAKDLFEFIDCAESHPHTNEIAAIVREDFNEISRRLNKLWERVDDVTDDYEQTIKE